MNKDLSCRILLVDDDPDLLSLTEMLLKKNKYQVRTAMGGKECLDAIREERPDLLLLDVVLPDISGIDLCRQIKQDPAFASIHILLLSAMKTGSDYVSEGLETGADGYLVKPLLNRELLARVDASCRIIRAEKTVNALKARTDDILAAIPEILVEVDMNKMYVWSNHAGYDFFGEDVIGKEARFYYEGDQDTYQAVQQLFEGSEKATYVESWQRRKDGKKRLLAWWCQALRDESGKVKGALSSARDITQSKILENSLLESEQKFRDLFEKSTVGKSITLTDGTVSVNQAFCDIVGYSKEELSVKTWQEITHPDDILADSERVAKIIDGKTDSLRWEKRYIHKNGHPVWVDLSTRLQRDSGGNPLYFITGVIDISNRILAEKELLSAKVNAEESDRLKSAFLANMSHEIRTPMNGILGFAEMLKEPHLSGEQQHKYISIIEKSGMRMLNIINDIVSISKIEAGEMQVILSDTNINKQIEDLFDFFRPEAERKGIHLSYSVSLPDKDAILHTDQEKVYAILTNLIKNALKFTPSGSIEFGYKINKRFFEFFVRDSGTGVPANLANTIFERFRQGSEKLSGQSGGAGLGLTISKAYTEMLGGKMWMESEPGKGAAFFFTLPFRGEQSAETEPSDSPIGESNPSGSDESLKKLIILIAEDDEASEMIISKGVEPFAKEILKVKTGTETVELCRTRKDIDLVFMDIRMEDLDGYEATRQIREFNQQVIIIAQTAFAFTGERDKALDAGCNDYLPKPISRKQLREMVSRYC